MAVGRMQPDVDVDAIAKLKTKDDIVAALEGPLRHPPMSATWSPDTELKIGYT
jgi:hypothetical protein